MTTTLTRRRRNRVIAAVLGGVLTMLGTGGIVVLGAAPAASADPVLITSPNEPDPITSAVWPFIGSATPGDNVRVGVVGGPYCTTVADVGGDWTCNVEFPESGLNIPVQAISIPHTGAGQVEETKEYNVARETTIDENTDSAFVSNESVNPALSGTAAPFADVTGAVNGTLCATVADANGDYTCVATGAFLPGDGTYFAGNHTEQRPPGMGFFSQQRTTWYILDTSVTVPDASNPVDTTITHTNVDTSDTTPTISGVNGTAEGQSEVIVYIYRYSTNGTVPAWPAPPPPAFGSQYCTANSSPNGTWSCSGTALDAGSVYVFGLSQIDLAGNGPPSPDSEFSIQILPRLPAPAVFEPAIGYESVSDRTVHVRTENSAEGSMFVREGTTNLCTPTPLAVPTFQCDTVPLSNGYHTLSIFQTDQYGTRSLVATRLVHIGPYPVPLRTLDFTFVVTGPNGEVGIDGLSAGDPITITASGLPLGTAINAEIHSTPVSLGGTTIGPDGKLSLATVIPDIEPGDHDIVVSAEAPGYSPATKSNPLVVREAKQLGDPVIPEEIKELGEPNPDFVPGQGTDGPGGSSANGHGFFDPTIFGSSVADPFDASAHAFALSPAGIILSGSLALAFLLLIAFPAELLESTIRSNYDQAFGWLGRLRQRVRRFLGPVRRLLANPWVGTGLSVAAAAFILGFADPDYGFNGASVRLFLAMVISVVVINIGLSVIVMRVADRAFGVTALLKPMPAALAIVAISVLVSRLAGIWPGFLFGIVLGVAYARELRLRDEARLGVLGVGLTIAAGIVAWLGYGLASTASGPGFFNNLLIESLAAITLEALGTLVIALLPIDFLDGRTIFRWSKLAWAGLYAVTLLVFVFIVVPLSDNWGTTSSPIFGFGTLFAVFAAVAIITWAVFRRRARATTSSPADAGPRQQERR